MTARDIDRARDALQSLDPNCDRPTWVKIGMASHAAGLSFDDFNDWSAGADSYNAQACRETWRSFKTAPGGVGAGALFGMARDAGWTDQKKPGIDFTELLRSKPATKPAEPPRKPTPGNAPAEVWNRLVPVLAHGYIDGKRANGVPLGGLRMVPADSALSIAMQSMAGALAVPAYAPDGTMQSIQFIPAPGKGKKLNLPGASMAGAWFTVGNIKPGEPVYLCEGIGTAWACWMATGAAAVVCFGWGNVGKVATALRQSDADARLVICPDVGKESAADKIAAEVGAGVAKMPDGWPDNSDLNDLFCSPDGGFDVVQQILEDAAATEPPKPEVKVHPLARFIDFDGIVRPPDWVIPGFIPTGVVSIAGAPGVGKTTCLMPLALTAAGLHGDEMLPIHWRHCIYVSEDTDQANRILTGMVHHSNLGITIESVRERIHLVEAVRLDPEFVATAGKAYRELFTRNIQGVEVLPLVILDTKSAVMALDNENDNSEASRMMASLKQGFAGLPVWLVGHVAKANLGRSDVAGLSARGAGSVDGDGNQTMYLVREGDVRYLVLGKVRFEPKWPELEIVSYTAQTTAPDKFGNIETIMLRWGIAAPAKQSRKEAAEQAAEALRQSEAIALRQDIRDAVQVAWMAGNPLGREGVSAKVNRRKTEVLACLENLLSERWIHEVFVPAKERLYPRKSSFFVNLTTEEHETLLSGGTVPADKLVVPASWQKPPVSIVPEAGHECTTNEEAEHA